MQTISLTATHWLDEALMSIRLLTCSQLPHASYLGILTEVSMLFPLRSSGWLVFFGRLISNVFCLFLLSVSMPYHVSSYWLISTLVLMQILRKKFPQFSQLQNGMHMQQVCFLLQARKKPVTFLFVYPLLLNFSDRMLKNVGRNCCTLSLSP